MTLSYSRRAGVAGTSLWCENVSLDPPTATRRVPEAALMVLQALKAGDDAAFDFMTDELAKW